MVNSVFSKLCNFFKTLLFSEEQSSYRSACRGNKPFRSQSNEAEHLHHVGAPTDIRHNINV